MKQCKTCRYFERGYWAEELTPQRIREPQGGGNCELLLKVMRMNGNMLLEEKLYIQDNFGCVLHKQ